MLKEGNSLVERLPWLTLSAGAAALLIFLGPEGWSDSLQLDRSNPWADILWQAITSHLTHWNLDHLGWDLAMFGIVGALVEARSRRAWLGLFFASALAVSLSVLLWQSNLQFYRGLSGIDMAFVGYWLCLQLKDRRTGVRWMWGIGLLLTIAKPLFEILVGQALFVSNLGPGVSNVPLAHLVGVGVGLIFANRRAGARAMARLKRSTQLMRHSASAGPTDW